MSDLLRLRGTAADKATADAKAARRLPRPGQRIDLGIVAVLAGLAALGGLGAWAVAGWLEVSGLLAPPLPDEVQDPRILSDYRDNPSPMVDLVPLGDDLLIGHEDGSIDRFDMQGRTFATEALPRDGALTGRLDLLSADCAGGDCGALPGTADTAFAVTDKGGLARRDGGNWRVVLGDGAFTGLDGVPVEQADLRGWAVSTGGGDVLADAGAKGLGLFNQRDGSWKTGPALAEVTQGPVFYDGAFWLGSARGVHRIVPAIARSGSGQPTNWGARPEPGTDGQILDLALKGDDGLLVLRRAACSDGGAGCLSVLGIGRGGSVTTILQEVQSNPDLNDSGLSHVALQGDRLITLGQAGIHVYDAKARHWQVIDPQPPTAYFAETDGQRLHVALPDRVVSIGGGSILREVKLKDPLVQVLPGDGTTLFGLDRKGQILALAPPEAKVLLPADTGSPAQARYVQALALGDLFVALGPQGILIHDVAARRYSFVPAQSLPPLPLSDAILVAGTAGRIWLTSRSSGEVWILTIGGDFPAKTVQAEALGGPGEPVVQAHAEGSALVLVGASGMPYRLQPDGQGVDLVGTPLDGSFSPVSVTGGGDGYVFTDGRDIWLYDAAARGWQGPMAAPGTRHLVDLALGDQSLFALNGDGTLYLLGDPDWHAVSAGPQRAAFGLDGLQDAMASGGTLFLASDDRVQSYLPGARHFGSTWQVGGKGAEILAIENGLPIWTNSAGVFDGQAPIYSGNDFIDGWMGADGPVAFGRMSSGQAYAAGPGGCLFAGAPAPTGEMRDVVQLDGERLLVVTADGAGIYEPRLHRWLEAWLPGLRPDSRLLRLGDHLVRLEPDAMASVPISAINHAASCEAPTISITWAINVIAGAASLVDGADEILLLERAGALRRWRDGTVTDERPAPGQAPVMAQLMRAYPSDGGVDLLTATALWHYDTDRRVWSTIPFQGAPTDVAHIDMVAGANGAAGVLTIWDGAGDAWSATLPGQQGGAISFGRLTRPVLPVIPVAPSDIRDLAQLDDRIVLLTDNRLLVYPKNEAQPSLDVLLPPAQRNWELSTDDTGALVLTDGPFASALSFHRLDPAETGQGALGDLAARYRPGDDLAYAFIRNSGSSVWPMAVDLTLYRIDAEMNTWRCRLGVGERPDCELVVGPPMPLEADAVTAYASGPRILLTADALWRLDEDARPQERIDGPVVRPDGQLLPNGDARLYWEGPGRALWRIDATSVTQLHSRIEALRPAGASFAALLDGQVVEVRNGELVEAPLPEALEAETLRLAHFTAQGDVWLTEAGQAAADGGKLVSDPRLTFAPDARSVLPVPGPSGGGRWLEEAADGRLTLRFMGECEVPAPQPPPPPPEFIGPPPPHATLPPQKIACAMEKALPAILEPGERVMDLGIGQGGGLTVLTDRRDITLSADLATVTGTAAPTLAVTPDGYAKALPVGGVKDAWGGSYLNPPLIQGNQILGGARALSYDPLPGAPLPAFDEGWLAWQRADGTFRFGEAASAITLPPDQALDAGGNLLPLAPGQALALPGGVTAWVTQSGLWHQDGDKLRPVALAAQTLPQGIDLGRFLWNGGTLDALTGDVTQTPPPRDFASGGIGFRVDPLDGQVEAFITVDGQDQPDLAGTGFLHDQRLGVAQSGAESVYLTPLGLIPVDTLSGGRQVPQGTVGIAGDAGRLMAATSSRWFGWSTTGWAASGAPFQDATLAQENGRSWERRNGQITVSSVDPWRVARQGLSFDMDALLGFAATPTMAVAVTRAGTHAAPVLADLEGAVPPVDGPPSRLPIDAKRVEPSRHVLYSASGEVWDGAASGWRAAGAQEKPWLQRLAARVDGITIDFSPAPRATIDVVPLGGGTDSVTFKWAIGEAMPFDHVLSIHADPGESGVLIGTRLGLRALSQRGVGFTNGPIYLPGGPDQAQVSAVPAMGRPDTTPDRIEVAYADGTCAEMPDLTDKPVACASPQGLANRFVALTEFWHVTKFAASVRWSYLIDGTERPLQLPLSSHFPHDVLADKLTCSGVQVEAWRDLPILRIDMAQYQLDGLQSLQCQEDAADLDGGLRLQSGLYALTGTAAYRFDGAGFTPVSAAELAGLKDRIDGRVTMEKDRLQYGLDQGLPLARTRSLSDLWVETPWANGRMELDQPRALAWRDGLQSITDAGVVPAPDGKLSARALVVMQGADDETLRRCTVLGAEALDGRSHGLDAQSGAPLRLYCRDGSWLEGVADGRRDIGAFSAATPKESERPLVSVPGLWSITATFGTDGKARAISVLFRDEPARLSGGRFDFDAFRAIAAPFGVTADLLADSGWWRAPSDALRLDATVRAGLPFDPRRVTGLTDDRSRRNGERGLCLKVGDDAGQFWGGGTSLESAGRCREARGKDPLWRWWDEGGKAQAEGIGLNGIAVERKLVLGRYEDLIVTGAPLAAVQGKLLVPTRAGVLLLPPGVAAPEGLYVLDANGALSRSAAGAPVWVDAAGATLLEGPGAPADPSALACPDLSRLASILPEGNRLQRLRPQPEGWFDVLVTSPAYRVQILVDCQDPSRNAMSTARLDVSDQPRNLARGASRAQVLEMSLAPEGIALSDGTRQAVLDDVTLPPMTAMAASADRDELFVISAGRLLSISVDAALGALDRNAQRLRPSEQVSPPATPAPSPAPKNPEPAPTPPAAAPPTPSAPPPPQDAPSPDKGLLPPDPNLPADPPASAPEPEVKNVTPPPSATGPVDEADYDARAVQVALAQALAETIRADGAIGPRSRAAIARWQASIGSDPTGYLGPEQVTLLLQTGAP